MNNNINNEWSKVISKGKKKYTKDTKDNRDNKENYKNPYNDDFNDFFDDFNNDGHYEIENFKNKKKILCNNTIKNVVCTYGTKCLYAHSIAEQKIDEIRKKAIDAIQNEFDLSYINFNEDEYKSIIKTFLLLTNLCNDCQTKKCPGGINCKFGAYDSCILLCYDDLTKGQCKISDCKKIHLTERGFKCLNDYNNDKKKKKIIKHHPTNYTTVYIPEPFLLSDDFFKKIENSNSSNSNNNVSPSVSSLSSNDSKKFKNNFRNKESNLSDDSCEESIFS